MSKAEGSTKSTQNKFFIMLLMLAALSSVVKDVNRLHSWASVLLRDSMPSAQASGLSSAESIEIKDISADIDAEPTVGGEIEVTATKRARRSDPATVSAKVLRSARGITNVDTRTVSRNVSNTRYRQARTITRERNARLGNSNWPNALELKTIYLDLPASPRTKLQVATFNGEIISDFPLTVLGRFGRKRISDLRSQTSQVEN